MTAAVTDAEAGEYDGRAICRECGDDLPDDLAAYDVGWCPACAGVGAGEHDQEHDHTGMGS